jgi:hypothetical protein
MHLEILRYAQDDKFINNSSKMAKVQSEKRFFHTKLDAFTSQFKYRDVV